MQNFFRSNLKYLKEKRGETQNSIALQVNKKHNTVGNWLKGNTVPDLNDLIVLSKYFDISYTDLIHIDLSKERTTTPGPGRNYPENHLLSMVKETDLLRAPRLITIDPSGQKRAVLVPFSSRQDYASGYTDPAYIGQLPSFNLPNFDDHLIRLFEIQGQDMLPTLHNQEIVVGKFIENLAQVVNGQIHIVLTTKHGLLIRRCFNRLEEEGTVVLKSDNIRERDLYPELIITPGAVQEIWAVAGYISQRLPVPDEQDERLKYIELQLGFLQEKIRKAGF